MKPSAPILPRSLAVFAMVGLSLLLAATGCSHHAPSRPASTLSPQDRTVLTQYEQIRAALAADDVTTAKAAAASLAKSLAPAGTTAPAPEILTPVKDLAAAAALDRARQIFKILSAKVIPLADGVEGYYVMTCPVPSAGDWIQTSPTVDNPYMGKGLHDYGEVKK